MNPTPAPRRSLTLADVTIRDVIAQLLGAAEELNLAAPKRREIVIVLEGVAKLLRLAGDAVDGDGRHATSQSAWLLAALLDQARLAAIERWGGSP